MTTASNPRSGWRSTAKSSLASARRCQRTRRYYDAWTSGDSNTVAALLSPAFRFTTGDLRIDGREAFLDSGAFPRDATVTMVAEAYQDDVAFQLYDATRGDRTIRVVEQLSVRDGQIISSNFVADMAAFAAFIGAGAPAEAEDHR